MSRARFAALAATDPVAIVRRWKALTGGKAIVVSPPFTAPELVHSFGMLPVLAETPLEIRSFAGTADGWIVSTRLAAPSTAGGKPYLPLPERWPGDVEASLDLLEAIAEWAGAVAGRTFSEGALLKSVALYRERDALVRRFCATEGPRAGKKSGIAPGSLIRSGIHLPVEIHLRLVAAFLPDSPPPPGLPEPEGERSDPLIVLAKRSR